jgi:hypothetical protein
MTNRLKDIIDEISKKLKNAGIKSIILYPENYPNIGNRYPMAIIKETRQDYVATSGMQYEYNMYLSIIIVSDRINDRLMYMHDLQAKIFNVLFKDCTLNGKVANINPIQVNFGDILSSDINAYPGFTETNSFMEINLQLLLYDER